MTDDTLSRRQVVIGAAAFAMAPAAAAQSRPRNIVIASTNGVRACARAMQILRSGGDTLDAVIAGVNINEEDPEDTSVGYGGLPNEEGVVELDASVMHGPTRRGGAVASLQGIKTPSKVARLVMEQSDHMMLVGEGALRFAKAHGFKEEDLLTEKSRQAWLDWKRSLKDGSGHTNWGPGLDAPPTGTINCLALNEKGEMSGVTSTSGLAWKIPGRVGDSPIIGAGLYVDQDVGAAGSTGRGEENIRICGAHTVVENMRHGMSPSEAVLDALKRVARNFNTDLKRLAAFNLSFYALRKDGQYAGASLWDRSSLQAKPSQFAVSAGDAASRLEPMAFLYPRR
jgi:N4-(beta-N-acetylglucosaminyl)-L-asparaginase